MTHRHSPFSRFMALALAIFLFTLVTGCQATLPGQDETPSATPLQKPSSPEAAVVTALFTSTPVHVDGRLDDGIWHDTPSYSMSLSRDRTTKGTALAEAGDVQFAWDADHFYVAIRFHDSDIIAEGNADQLHHYTLGDLAELFLKPEGRTWYWELYVTPRGNKSSFWFPGRGRVGLPSSFQYECGLRVAARNNGTINDWKDRDHYWTAEMAMPIEDLTSHGDSFGPGSRWRILLARYNYSRYLPASEKSMSPPLPRTDFHRYEDYGVLHFSR